jgi:hypothetical protein
MRRDEILDYLKEFKHSSQNKIFSEIGLFGSYARNQADVFSDVDIAVKINKDYLKEHDIWDYFNAINDMKKNILKRFNLQSDIFDLESSSTIVEKIKKDIIYV